MSTFFVAFALLSIFLVFICVAEAVRWTKAEAKWYRLNGEIFSKADLQPVHFASIKFSSWKTEILSRAEALRAYGAADVFVLHDSALDAAGWENACVLLPILEGKILTIRVFLKWKPRFRPEKTLAQPEHVIARFVGWTLESDTDFNHVVTYVNPTEFECRLPGISLNWIEAPCSLDRQIDAHQRYLRESEIDVVPFQSVEQWLKSESAIRKRISPLFHASMKRHATSLLGYAPEE